MRIHCRWSKSLCPYHVNTYILCLCYWQVLGEMEGGKDKHGVDIALKRHEAIRTDVEARVSTYLYSWMVYLPIHMYVHILRMRTYVTCVTTVNLFITDTLGP